MVAIQSIHALEILDSRGFPTIRVRVSLSDGSVGEASVPSGASTGEHEALELRDKDPKRYMGKGVLKAVSHVNNELAKLLVGKEASDQRAIDQMMIDADGTPNKSKFGANAILGVSLAVCKAVAASCGKSLYEHLALGQKVSLPCPMMNILNGGAHADNGLDFQEFMIRPIGAPTFSEALRYGSEVFHTLKQLLKERGFSTGIGDEGGFAPELASNEEALDFIMKAIDKAGFKPGKDITLALDAAASEFYDASSKSYVEMKKKQKGEAFNKRSSLEQIEYLDKLANDYPIDSIEDGLDQNDWEGWTAWTQKSGSNYQIVGDDIFVTNPKFLQRAIDEKAANAILIKLNQIGTLTETLDTIAMAKKHGYKTVISHRSGETEDTTIADLAVGISAGQIKTGSLCRSERTAKYNRLLEIEERLGR